MLCRTFLIDASVSRNLVGLVKNTLTVEIMRGNAFRIFRGKNVLFCTQRFCQMSDSLQVLWLLEVTMHPRRIRKLSYLFSVHLCLQHGISKHTKQFSGIRGSDDIADQLRREIRHIIIMRGSPQPLGWCEESEAACSFSGTLYIKHKNLSHSHTRSKPLYFNN